MSELGSHKVTEENAEIIFFENPTRIKTSTLLVHGITSEIQVIHFSFCIFLKQIMLIFIYYIVRWLSLKISSMRTSFPRISGSILFHLVWACILRRYFQSKHINRIEPCIVCSIGTCARLRERIHCTTKVNSILINLKALSSLFMGIFNFV